MSLFWTLNSSDILVGVYIIELVRTDLILTVSEAEEICEASDLEKWKAMAAINNILSLLTHYSELTGRLVCGKRSNSVMSSITSSLNISLGRIKQSFVL